MPHHHKHHSHSQSQPHDSAEGKPGDPPAADPAATGQGDLQTQPDAQPGPGDSLSIQLEALKKENADLLARLQRVSADYMNYQKRAQKDMAVARDFANETVIKTMLGVMDDMDRAIAGAKTADDPLLAGIRLVRDKMFQSLQGFGVTVIEAKGQPFDPDHHSAVMQEPDPSVPPMTVVRELARGFALKGRTIRPAMVVVSKAPDPAPEPALDEQPAEDDEQ